MELAVHRWQTWHPLLNKLDRFVFNTPCFDGQYADCPTELIEVETKILCIRNSKSKYQACKIILLQFLCHVWIQTSSPKHPHQLHANLTSTASPWIHPRYTLFFSLDRPAPAQSPTKINENKIKRVVSSF
jgi:hypothetical protein